jgi:plastocyanin
MPMTRRAALTAVLFVVSTMLPLAPAHAGGYCHDGGNTQEATTEVDMKGDCFFPTVAHIDVGDKVTWRNFDSENHIVLGVGGSWGAPEVAPNAVTALRFDKPGVYPYWCHIHLGMVGAVVVGDGQPTASAGGSGDGPVATLAFTGDQTADGTQGSDARAQAEPIDSRTATAGGIDWGALAVAAALILATAAALSGFGSRLAPRKATGGDQKPATSS